MSIIGLTAASLLMSAYAAQGDELEELLTFEPPDCVMPEHQVMGVNGLMLIGESGPKDREEGRRGMERLRLLKLLELLNLDEKREGEFITMFRQHRERQKELFQKRREIVDRLATGLKSHSIDEKEIKSVMAQIDETDREQLTLMHDFREQVQTVLTVEEVGKLYVFQARFEGEVLEKMGEFRRRRPMMPHFEQKFDEDSF